MGSEMCIRDRFKSLEKEDAKIELVFCSFVVVSTNIYKSGGCYKCTCVCARGRFQKSIIIICKRLNAGL